MGLTDRRNTQDLNRYPGLKTYSCGLDGRNECFRFIRLRQTGKSSCGANFLSLAAMEFFGTLFHVGDSVKRRVPRGVEHVCPVM